VSQNVIELNGKRYDAVTGAYLSKSTTKTALSSIHNKTQGRVIDGFIRQSARPTTRSMAVAPARPMAEKKIVTKKTIEKHLAMPAHTGQSHKHTTAAAVAHHRPEHAKTLMRHSVRKPEMTLKPAIKPQSPAAVMTKPVSTLAHKASVASVDPIRLERAKAIVKHTAVRHFPSDKKGVEPTDYTARATVSKVPVIPVRTQPTVVARSATPTTQRPDMFEAAIKHAKSHEEPFHKQRRTHRRRFINTLAIVATFIVLGGFVSYLNLPNIQLHIASLQAGFHATIPGYKPTGYALRGNISHSGGTVSMHFTSGDSSYVLTEQSSNWDSQTLLDNTLALAGQHETIERGGRTIYIYDNGNASWVTGNVRYDITGNASLSRDDLAHIASSM